MLKFLNKPKIQLLIAIIILIVIICLMIFDTRIRVVNYKIMSNKIQNTIKIALITDLHSTNYGDDQKTLIETIENQNPDIVLYSGDILDDIVPHKDGITLMTALSQKYPSYYVSGNHEFWSDDIDDIKQIVRDCGVTVLEGESEVITLNEQTIRIAGVDDPTYDPRNVFEEQLKSAQPSDDDEIYTVLLSHRPELIDTYLQYNYDLVLSGHAHGGQWRIPYILNGLYAPDQGLFPKYAGGQYDFENQTMIVSRGLALSYIPRVFNRPEVVIIDLA